MPHAALTRPSADEMLESGSIESLTPPTHDEAARQRFVSTLRKRIMVDMAARMGAVRGARASARGATAERPATGGRCGGRCSITPTSGPGA